MPLYRFCEFQPTISDQVFVAPDAQVMGKVELHREANVWFGCLLRGDINKIVVGEGSNIQDLSILHVVEEFPCLVGKGVTVGHGAILHACTVEDYCLIGMGATVLDGAVIGAGSLVAAGSLVPPGKKYPPNSMIMGNPAKVVRELTQSEQQKYHNHYKTYVEISKKYLDPKTFSII